MPIPLEIRVENPDAILRTGLFGAGALIRVQSSATQAGVFADLTGTGSNPTVPIVTLVRIYTADDPNGTVSTWYRTRFENAAATRLSDWSDAFQPGADAGSGLLCSLDDVKQRLGLAAADTTQDEDLLEFIGQVSFAIQGYTGRRFARSPASGTTTFLYDVRQTSKTLWIPNGIAEAGLLEVAFLTGGAFQTVPAADWFLDPPPAERDYGWPATRITLSPIPTGGVPFFYYGKRVVRVTMAEGWEAVPLDIEGIALRATISNYLSKGSGASGIAMVGPSGAMTVLRDIGPKDMATLDWYAVKAVG